MARRKKPAHLTGILLISEQKIATVRLIEQVLGDYCTSVGIPLDSRIIARMSPDALRPGVLPIFCRTSDEWSDAWMRELVTANWPFLYFIDDDFWSLDKATALGRYYGHPFIRKALAYSISKSLMTLASTTYLAGKLQQFGTDVRVMTPHVHPYLLEGTVRRGDAHRGRVRLGFASNISRLGDLDFLLPELERALREHSAWEVDFIGVKPDIDPTLTNVTFLPYQDDYQSYIDLIRDRRWDIVLSPLLDSESARSKTNNKYREFAALGVPGVFSNVGAYAEVVDGELGIVVENTADAWRTGIARLADDADLRHRIAKNAKADARDKYALPRVVDEWAQVFSEAAQHLATAPYPFVRPKVRGHYWHIVQDLAYETITLTKVFGPVRGAGYLVRESRRILHTLWERKLLARFYPDALTRVWMGDFSKTDVARLLEAGHPRSGKRIRSLRKTDLSAWENGELRVAVPPTTAGLQRGLFLRLHPTSLVADLTVVVSKGQREVARERITLRPEQTFQFVPVPGNVSGAGYALTMTLAQGDDAAVEDVVVIVDSATKRLPVIALSPGTG